ncbi:hypothetical protein ACFL5A_04785, partial [Gemmatimonadota bacterium]
MDDVDPPARFPGHPGDAPDGTGLRLRRTTPGMVDGLGPALGQLLQGDLVDDGAVLGVDHQHPTGLPQSRGKAEIILVGDDPTRLSAVHIHRRLTGQRTEGHEAFDGGEAGSHHLGNLLQDLRG